MQVSFTLTAIRLNFIGLLLIFTLPGFTQITVDRFMGINTLREDPVEKMKAVGFIREYHSWYLNEGNPSLVQTDYSPGYPNAIYRWDKTYQDLTFTRFGEFYNKIRKENDVQIAPSFQGNIFQIVDPDRYTHLGDNHIVQEQKPIKEGANSLNPAAYIAHAAYLYQYAARYGHNQFSINDLNRIIVPKTHPEETPKTGLGLVEYMESWNEQDKWWWRGTHPNTYFSPQEYAAMLSADYDGHGQSLGEGVGIKNADPDMKVVMGGLAEANLDYIRAMVDWSVSNRSPNALYGQLPFQVLNIHHYIGNNPNFLQSTQGISPEQADLRGFLKTFDEYRDSLNAAMGVNLELWLSEFGYDTYGEGAFGTPVVIAPQIGKNDSYEVQGQWIIRCYLEALAAGIDRAMLYFLRDEQTPYAGLYTSSGLLESAANDFKPKNSWFYTYTMKNVLTDMVFDADVSPCEDTSCVRIYRFKEIGNGNKKVYALWSPTSSAKEYNYQFRLEDANGGTLVKMELPSIWGISSKINIAYPLIPISEKPVFIIKNGDQPLSQACNASISIENASCGSLNVRLNAKNKSDKYQLWYMKGNFKAADFSLRQAKVASETASDGVLTIANLEEDQPYTFFLFPKGVGRSETNKICTVTGITSGKSNKIIIDPAWIYDDYKNHLNPAGLFDNQNDFDPLCDPNAGFPEQGKMWGYNYDLSDSMNVSLDLQGYYYIDALSIHDAGSRGFFTIQIADSPNGSWTTVTDYLTKDYNVWKTMTNIFPAGKPIRFLRFIAEKNDAAKVGEVYLYGRKLNLSKAPEPEIEVKNKVSKRNCDGIDLCKIPLDPSMVYDYFRLLENAQKLVDEQSVYDPICNPSTVPTDLWGSDFTNSIEKEYASLDLQGYYDIDHIYLHDGGGLDGTIQIQVSPSPNGPWTTVVNYPAVKFNDWITFTNPIPNNLPQLTRYIRFVASADDVIATGEIFICGTLDPNFNPDIKPGIGRNGRATSLSCDSVSLKWDPPFDQDIKEYKVFGGPMSFTTTVPNITIKNLTQNTSYNFKIVTVDNANQESTDTLKIDITTYIDGECSLNCNLSCPCAICLRPDWLTRISPATASTQFDKSRLIDDQDKVPFCGETGIGINTIWGYNFEPPTIHAPAEVEINLQQVYIVDNFHFFSRGGGLKGYIEIDYKNENDQWIRMANDSTGGFEWKKYGDLDLKTQYFRVRLLDDNAGLGEIGICGSPFVPCNLSNLDLSNSITRSDTLKAKTIIASTEILNGLEVGFYGETAITLQKGFYVPVSTKFLAKIEACPDNFTSPVPTPDQAIANTFSQSNLGQNSFSVFPNPFQTNTTFAYKIVQEAMVHLAIFDGTGRIIKTLIDNQIISGGTYRKDFYPTDIERGFYIARLQIGKEVLLKKLVIASR